MSRRTVLIIQGSPRFLAFLLGSVGVVHAHGAFGKDFNLQAALLAVLLLAVGCAVAQLLWEAFPQFLATPRRELIGIGFVLAALVVILAANAERPIERLEGWQWAIITMSLFAFTLHSQASYMMFLAGYASLALLALSLRPSVAITVCFGGLTLALFSALAQREAADRFPEEARWFRFEPPLTYVARLVLALAVVFSLFYVNKPPAQAASAKEWLQWFRQKERPDASRSEGVIPGGAPQGGGGQGVPEPGEGTEGPSHDTASSGAGTVSFGTDLKFGAGPEGGDAVAMYVDVRRVDGKKVDLVTFRPYWTASAATRYDGKSWTGDPGELRELTSPTGRIRVRPVNVQARGTLYEQRVVLMPLADRSLFALYPVEHVYLPRVVLDREGVLRRARSSQGRFKYRVVSRWNRPGATRLVRARVGPAQARYTQVPEAVLADPAFKSAVEAVRYAGNRPYDRIRGALQLFARYRYTLRPKLDPDADPTLEFFRKRRGYCQHFASAMALILRSLKIPTRIGIGYSGGEWNARGRYYLVRRRHAHAWVEVQFQRHGWVVFDPAGVPLESSRGTDVPIDPPPTPDPLPPEPPPSGPDGPDPPDTPDPLPTLEPSTPAPTPTEAPTPDPSPSPTESPSPSPTPTPTSPPPTPRPSPTRRDPDAAPLTGPKAAPPTPKSAFESIWSQFENDPKALGSSGGGSAGGGGSRGPRGSGGSRGGGGGGGASSGTVGSTDAGPQPHKAAARFLASALFRDLLAVALLISLLLALAALYRTLSAAAAEEDEEQADGADDVTGEARHATKGSIKRPNRQEVEVVAIYLELLSACAKRGLARGRAETALEFARRLLERVPQLTTLTTLFERARYGPVSLGETEAATARALLGEAMQSLQGGSD